MFFMGFNEFGSKKNKEAKKHPLNSGIPCKIHNCFKCCIETRMPLTQKDIERISEQGYRFKEFVVKRRGERCLKNRKGGCVFLEDNECTIYSFRPEGCQLYPLLYDEDDEKGVIHDFCPYGHEFNVSSKDIDNLYVLIKKLAREVLEF
jgi:Fe-S-cluster containining protein